MIRVNMADNKKFRILRGILYGLGLSKKSANDVVDWIVQLMEGDDGDSSETYYTLPENGKKVKLPYAQRDDFLSPAELNFYRVLMTTLQGRMIVFTKVGMSDIFYVKTRDRSEYQTYLNKIDRKHVDFLLCHANSLQPICAIELDDKSHQRKDRQERDRFVDAVFEVSDLPIVHIPVKQAYSTSALNELLSPYLMDEPQENLIIEPVPESIDHTPNCPRCDSEMILRTAKSGNNKGNQFWGCSNYPKCRGMIQVEDKLSG